MYTEEYQNALEAAMLDLKLGGAFELKLSTRHRKGNNKLLSVIEKARVELVHFNKEAVYVVKYADKCTPKVDTTRLHKFNLIATPNRRTHVVITRLQ